MISKVHFVSFSPCGGTEKIVHALGRDITLPWQEYNITLPASREHTMPFGENDLVFLGFPVYGGRMPRLFASLIACLRGSETPVVLVAVYGNREYEGAFLDMHEAVRAQGFKPIAAVAAIAEHSVAPHIATNRPDAEDAEKLAAYGMSALQRAQDKAGMIDAPGAYPTWKMSPSASVFPRVDEDLCNGCGVCVRYCPSSAIPEDSPQSTVVEKCLVCAACVKYCPQKARQLGDPRTRKELASHLDHAVERKEPVLF